MTSEDLIGPTSGGKVESGVNCFCLTGQDGVKYGSDELEAICKFYANGKFATRGRNLTVDDLNNITGYTPSFDKLSSGAIYDEDMTFSWNGSNGPAFVTKNSVYGNISGTLSKSHKAKGFNWINYDTKTWNNSPFSSVAQVITTLHIDYYYYWISSLNIKQNFLAIGLDTSSVEYKLMFTNSSGNSDGYCYWTSSNFTNGNKDYISYGLYVTEEGLVVGGAPLYYSYGEDELGYYGIKPIIKLSSQIKLTPNGENNFSISWDENY
ncbi:MAG: hypothetical protein IJV31_12620 [Clostridia bacterium]|nr:hypothetical protein [Clostridia bacterium]